MSDNLYPLQQQYDLLAVFRSFYNLLYGCAKGMNDWGCRNHDAWVNFMQNLPFNVINFYAKFVVFALIITLALLVLVIIYVRKEKAIQDKIMSKILPKEQEQVVETANVKMENPKWKLVLEHIGSDDANKWKLAILEADIILSELLDSIHLKGEGVGEKLKNVEAGDFEHIEQAWEAHKIRNAIAHQGSDFLITQREAKRVIELYRLVFEEFEVI